MTPEMRAGLWLGMVVVGWVSFLLFVAAVIP